MKDKFNGRGGGWMLSSVYFSQGLLWKAEVRTYWVRLVSNFVPFNLKKLSNSYRPGIGNIKNRVLPVPVAARLLRSWVRIPPGAWMFVVSVVFCQVEVSATSWSLVQRSPTDCGASLRVIYKTSRMRRSWPALGRSATAKKKRQGININYVN